MIPSVSGGTSLSSKIIMNNGRSCKLFIFVSKERHKSTVESAADAWSVIPNIQTLSSCFVLSRWRHSVSASLSYQRGRILLIKTRVYIKITVGWRWYFDLMEYSENICFVLFHIHWSKRINLFSNNVCKTVYNRWTLCRLW